MRQINFGHERDDFRRQHQGHVAQALLQDDLMLAAMERGLGLPDDVLITGLYREPSFRGWFIMLTGPTFPECAEGVEAPQVNIVMSETRIDV